MGMYEWTINSTIELFEIARAGYASAISPVVEQVTGKTFSQFARDYYYIYYTLYQSMR